MGQSITTGPVGDADGFIPLERTEGFPAQGVARIGNELVEYVLSAGGLDCTFNETGPLAGFGGRFAREMHDRETTDPADVTIPAALERGTLTTSYPSGTTVQNYGYTIPASSNIPAGGAVLPRSGAWRGLGMAPDSEADMDPIFAGPFLTDWGKGYEAAGYASPACARPTIRRSAWRTSCRPSAPRAATRRCWWRWNAGNGSGQGDAVLPGTEHHPAPPRRRRAGALPGWQGDTLSVIARGDDVLNEPQVPGEIDLIGGNRVFVLDWRDFIVDEDWTQVDEVPSYGVFLVPISVPAPGAGHLLPAAGAGSGQRARPNGQPAASRATRAGVVSEYARRRGSTRPSSPSGSATEIQAGLARRSLRPRR